MIVIVDYGAGNLRSVVNAITKLGHQPRITSHPDELLNAQAVILPGVGAAGDTMANLRKLGLASPIRQIIAEGRPFFGVCIGLQILFTATEEGGWHECLSIIPGRVRKLPPGLKIPHMGWNQVKQRLPHPVFEGIPGEQGNTGTYLRPKDSEDLFTAPVYQALSLVAPSLWQALCLIEYNKNTI